MPIQSTSTRSIYHQKRKARKHTYIDQEQRWHRHGDINQANENPNQSALFGHEALQYRRRVEQYRIDAGKLLGDEEECYKQDMRT